MSRALLGALLASTLTAISGLTPGVEVEPANEPFLIPLRRELYPVRRKGKIVSHKASYSGLIHVGSPWEQEFRVVFDTGSGHIILPAVECRSDACLKHRRYDAAVSETSESIMLDGSRVVPGKHQDQVTIGFGTGKIMGQFVRERVCLGPAQPAQDASGARPDPGPCVEAQMVAAIEMSNRPFELFDFDGILGLSLAHLAVHKNFSFFEKLADSRQFGLAQFGIFLADGDSGEESEIAMGGHNVNRLLEPLSWVSVAKPELGYWQVHILGVRVDGVLLDMCADGTCYGIIDSGTSHLGIPSHHNNEIAELLTREAEPGVTDCRRSQAPVIQLELPNFNFTLYPDNYMRKLPLEEEVMGDTQVGVSPTSYKENSDKEKPEIWTPSEEEEPYTGRYLCTPKLLPVTWPEPIGPNLFILGEPVLHQYYTVLDWHNQRAGFGLARHANRDRQERQEQAPAVEVSTPVEDAAAATTKTPEPQRDELVLLQTTTVDEVTRA